jgi:hypothetical protein
MEGSYEHGNEPLGSIKGRESDELSVLLASQESLCSMELLVSFVNVSMRLHFSNIGSI